MNNRQEAQQAQTIAHGPVAYAYEQYRRRLRHDAECKDAPRAVDDLIEMVISQSQKIAEQAKEIERLKNLVRKTSGVEPDAYKRQANPHNVWGTTNNDL